MVLKLLYATNCLNISQAWSDKQEIDDRDHVLRVYQGWLVLPAVALALPLTVLYMAACIRAIRSHRVIPTALALSFLFPSFRPPLPQVSRKFHVLLVNRALGDLLACLVSAVVILYVFLADHVNSHWVQLLNTLFVACFWSGLVTYTAIGFIKLYGIARPLHYKENVTMRRCLLLIKLSWLVFFLIVSVTMAFTLVVKIQALADWTGCKVESCLSWMYRIRNAFNVLLYLGTIGCFAITIYLIRKAKQRSHSLHAGKPDRRQQRSVQRRFRFPLVKLSLGVSTFALFHLPYALWCLALLFANGCYFVRHYNRMQTFVGFIRLAVLFRILLDQLLGFAMDREILRQLVLLLCPFRSVPERTATRVTSSTNSGVLSSESTPAADSLGRQRGEGTDENGNGRAGRKRRRTESSKAEEVPKGRQLQRNRHSDCRSTDTK